MKDQWKRITAMLADFKPEDRVTVPVGPLLWANEEIELLRDLLNHRADLQAQGVHPAPCARHCEANAFAIEIRTLKRERDALLETLKRCLPIIQADAQMMADISRHAPLPYKDQMRHDMTEYESERLVREIPALIASVDGAA